MMKLKNLIECNEAIGQTEITGITCDSRCVKEGYAFVCIKGAKSDGHDYAQKAVEGGAAVVVALGEGDVVRGQDVQ